MQANSQVAVTTGHELEISEMTFNFDGVQCGSKFANFEITTKARVRGQSKTGTSKMSIYDGQPQIGSALLGSQLRDPVADNFLVLVSEVSYPLDRTSVSFKVQLSQVISIAVFILNLN